MLVLHFTPQRELVIYGNAVTCVNLDCGLGLKDCYLLHYWFHYLRLDDIQSDLINS